MKTMTRDEYLAALRAQKEGDAGDAFPDNLCMVCPMCGTIQNARDLIAAGAGKDFEDVENSLGWACVGRWTHGNSPPKKKGKQVGCNWTLGGLFRLHELEVVTPDGERHPRFEPATPEDARAHVAKQDAAAAAG